MNTKILGIALLAISLSGLGFSANAGADSTNAGKSAAAVHKVNGTVNKINPDGTVNITHAPVPTLGWPAMTMDFQVKDKALLKSLKPGQKINFEIGMQPGGYVITAVK